MKLNEAIRNFNIKDRYDLWLRKELYSNFIDRTILKQSLPPVNESKELYEAIESNNIDEIKKEFSDVIYSLMLLTSCLIKEWLITNKDLQNMWKQQKEKIFKRSPFLKENKKVSIDEEEEARFKSKWTLKREI